MATANRVIKNTAYLYGKTLITMFTSLWTTRIILNALGAIDFGVYNVVAGSIALLGFLNSAMANTIQRFLNHAQGENDLEKQKAVFNAGIIFHGIIAIASSLFLLIFMIFLFDGILNIPAERINAAKVAYLSLVASTFFTIVGVPYDSALNAHEDMLYYSVVGTIESLLRLGIAFLLMYTSYDKLEVYAILMALVPILSILVRRFYCIRRYEECNFSPRRFYDKKIAREILTYSGWNLAGTTSSVLGNHGNNILLNHYFGAALNTVAGIANQLQGMLMVLSTGMMKALNPVIFKSEGEGNIDRMIQLAYKGCKYSYFLLGLLAFPMLYETQILLKLWLKDVPQWAIFFVRLQLIRALLEQLAAPLERSLQAVGHIKEINCCSIVYNLIPIVILSFLYSKGFLPYWHFVVSISVMVIIPCIIKIFLCNRYCHLKASDYFNNVLLPSIGVSILTTLLWLPFRLSFDEGVLRLLLSCGISVFSFLLFTYMFMSDVEKKTMKGLILKYCNSRI